MAELQTPPEEEKKTPQVEASEMIRSRVAGMGKVSMSGEQKELFEEAAQLQNKAVSELSKVPNTSIPEITDNMMAAIAHSQGVSKRHFFIGDMGDKHDLYRKLFSPHLTQASIDDEDKPVFSLGGETFDYTPRSDDEKNWVHAFNEMIDQIDPENNKRFVS